MKNRKLLPVFCLVIVIFVVLESCTHTKYYKMGLKLEATGNYEEALEYYLKELKLKPENAETKIAAKRTAKKVIKKKIKKAENLFKKQFYKEAYYYYQKAIDYIKLLRKYNLLLEIEPEIFRKYQISKAKACEYFYNLGNQALENKNYSKAISYFKECLKIDSYFKDIKTKLYKAEYLYKLKKANTLYEQAKRLMKEGAFKKAYQKLEEIEKLVGIKYRNIMQLMKECLEKGTKRISIIPAYSESKNDEVLRIIYTQVLKNLSRRKSKFLKILDLQALDLIMRERGLNNWNIIIEKRMGENLNLDGLVIIKVPYYNFHKKIIRTPKTVCYLTAHYDQFGLLYYSGRELTLDFCTEIFEVIIDVSYNIVNAKTGEVLISEVRRCSASDFKQFIDFSGDKSRLATDCPKPNTPYWPIWILQIAPEKLVVKTERELVQDALWTQSIIDSIVNLTLLNFD